MTDDELTIAICEKAIAEGLRPERYGVLYAPRLRYGDAQCKEVLGRASRRELVRTHKALQGRVLIAKRQANEASWLMSGAICATVMAHYGYGFGVSMMSILYSYVAMQCFTNRIEVTP